MELELSKSTPASNTMTTAAEKMRHGSQYGEVSNQDGTVASGAMKINPTLGKPPLLQHDAFVRKLALIASLSGLLFGYDTGVVSGAIIFLRPYMGLNNYQVEIIVASTVLSAGFSAIGGGVLMDKMGRKKTLIIASAIFLVGSLIMAVAFGPAKGFYVLVLGRITVGIAVGLAADAGPLYISECAPPKLRGSLTTLFNVAVVGGQVVASIVCGSLSYLPPSYNWRLMLGCGGVPAVAQMIGFIILPYSPTWLVLMGREVEAEMVLRKIRMMPKLFQDDGDDDSPDAVTQELNDILEDHEKAKKGKDVSLLDLWRFYPQVRRTMLLGCSLWAVSQLAGINTIMYYGASIVKRTGIVDGEISTDIWITVPLSAMQLIGIVVCFFIIDTKGRRPTLLISMSLVCVSLFFIGMGFAVDSSYLTVVAMFLYLFSFGVGLSTMPYTMNSEIYPEEYSSKCVAQATGVFWFTNFIVSASFLTLSRILGSGGVFFLYTGIAVVSEAAFFVYLPETSGLSLHEIQQLFCLPEECSLSVEGNDLELYTTNGDDADAGESPPLPQIT